MQRMSKGPVKTRNSKAWRPASPLERAIANMLRGQLRDVYSKHPEALGEWSPDRVARSLAKRFIPELVAPATIARLSRLSPAPRKR